MICSVLITTTTRYDQSLSSTVARFPTYEGAERACERMDHQKMREPEVKVRYLRLYKRTQGD